MSWEKIFEGFVMGDEITVERYVGGDSSDNHCVKVTATDKNPPQITPPIIDQGSIIFPMPPSEPTKKYTFEYSNIDDMYEKFAGDSGRTDEFTSELEKAIQNQ